MKRIATRALVMILMVVVALFACSVHLIGIAIYGGKWATYPTNSHLYSNGSLVHAGTITDRNGTVLASTSDGVRSFAASADVRKATLHAVGDLEGYVATGVHTAFLSELTGYDLVNGVYQFHGEGNDLSLTLDANLCVTAMKALGNHHGAVGVCNYKTGELICMVSTHTFDPQTESASAQGKGVYVNRLLSGQYAPGSIFKLVTCVAAIDNIPDIFQRKYTCNAGVTIDGEWLSCLERHGSISFADALTQSCKAAFGQIALDVGAKNMLATAEELGFNRALSVNGIDCAESRYDVENIRNIDLGWSGMGQYNDLVNPLQYLDFMATIANDGSSPNLHFVDSITTSYGVPVYWNLLSGNHLTLKSSTAEKLQEMMRNNVLNKYGDSRFAGLQLCAKTGTAEVSDDSTPHSWFVGFCQNEKKPYAFVVVAENAGSGLGTAASIAATVLKAAPEIS